MAFNFNKLPQQRAAAVETPKGAAPKLGEVTDESVKEAMRNTEQAREEIDPGIVADVRKFLEKMKARHQKTLAEGDPVILEKAAYGMEGSKSVSHQTPEKTPAPSLTPGQVEWREKLDKKREQDGNNLKEAA